MSRSDTWMPLYVGDYLRDTGHLTTTEHGAYMLLIMQAWTRGGALPGDEERLRLLSRLDPREWKASRDTLMEFFTLVDGAYRNKRVDHEIANTASITEQRRAAGKASAEARAKQREGNGKVNGGGNGSSTTVATAPPANEQQTARPSQPQSQEKSSVADATAEPAVSAPADAPVPDARTALWREGLGRLGRLTGKPAGASRALLGKMVQRAGDDCALVSSVLFEAEQLRPVEPVSWIEAAIGRRTGARGPAPAAAPKRSAALSNTDWMREPMGYRGSISTSFDFDGTAEETMQ